MSTPSITTKEASNEKRDDSIEPVDGAPIKDIVDLATKDEPRDVDDGNSDNEKLEKDEAQEEGEVVEDEEEPPLPTERVPGGPPLPNEPAPPQEDDGWDCNWDPQTQAWFFANRFTGKTQWENPRVSADEAATTAAPQPPVHEKPAAGGYNPAIHGDYDPNAWYAKGNEPEQAYDVEAAAAAGAAAIAADPYGSSVTFNRFTGRYQSTEEAGPARHSDEAKSMRQMNAYFDAESASNSHDGRSLRAERSHSKPSKSEVKAFKEKRRARKEEKRRAWLRD